MERIKAQKYIVNVRNMNSQKLPTVQNRTTMTMKVCDALNISVVTLNMSDTVIQCLPGNFLHLDCKNDECLDRMDIHLFKVDN